MMKTKISVILGLIMIGTFACAGAAQNQIDGKWKLTGYNFAEKRSFPIEKMEINLTVTDGTKIGGKSACNLYSGTIVLGPGGAMKLKTITMTEMACNEINGSFEGAFLQVLDKASRYEVKGNTLTITDAATGQFLRFEREGQPQPDATPLPVDKPPAAEHEIIFVANRTSPCPGIQKCLRVKYEKNDAWQDYNDVIMGFDPKPGRFYKIEIERGGDRRSMRPGIFHHKLVRILKTSTREKDIYR